MFVELECCEKCFMHKQYNHQEWEFHQNFCKLDQIVQRKCKLKILKNAIMPLPVLQQLQRLSFADNQFVEKLVEQQKLKLKPRIEAFEIKYRGIYVFSLFQSKTFPDFNFIAKILLIIKRADMNGLNLIDTQLKNAGASTIYELAKIKNQTSIEKALKLQFLEELIPDPNQKRSYFFASLQKKFLLKQSSLKSLKKNSSQPKIKIPKENLLGFQKNMENDIFLKHQKAIRSSRISQKSLKSKYGNQIVSFQQLHKEGEGDVIKKVQKQIRCKRYSNRVSGVNKKSSELKKLSKSEYDRIRQQRYEFLSKQSDVKCNFLPNQCFQLANLSESSDSDVDVFKGLQDKSRFNSFDMMTDQFCGTQLLQEAQQNEKTLEEKIQNVWSNDKQNFSKTFGEAFYPHNNDQDQIKISRTESAHPSPRFRENQAKNDQKQNFKRNESPNKISFSILPISSKRAENQKMIQIIPIKYDSQIEINQEKEDVKSSQLIQNHQASKEKEQLLINQSENHQTLGKQYSNVLEISKKKKLQQGIHQNEISPKKQSQKNISEEAQMPSDEKNSQKNIKSSTQEFNIMKSSQKEEKNSEIFLQQQLSQQNDKSQTIKSSVNVPQQSSQISKETEQQKIYDNKGQILQQSFDKKEKQKVPQTQKEFLNYFSGCLQAFPLMKFEHKDSNIINQSEVDQTISVEQFFSKAYPCPRIILETKSKKKVIKMFEALIQPYLEQKQSEKEWLEISQLNICKIFFIQENQSPQIVHMILFNRNNPEKTKFFITDSNQEIQSFIELEELEKQFKQVLFLFYHPSYQLKSCRLSQQNGSQVSKQKTSSRSLKFNVELKIASNISQKNDENADGSNHIFISIEMKNIAISQNQQKNTENKEKVTEPKIKIQVFRRKSNETQEVSDNLIGEIQKKGNFFFDLNLDPGNYFCVVEIFPNKAEKNLSEKQFTLMFYSLVDIETGKVGIIGKK